MQRSPGSRRAYAGCADCFCVEITFDDAALLFCMNGPRTGDIHSSSWLGARVYNSPYDKIPVTVFRLSLPQWASSLSRRMQLSIATPNGVKFRSCWRKPACPTSASRASTARPSRRNSPLIPTPIFRDQRAERPGGKPLALFRSVRSAVPGRKDGHFRRRVPPGARNPPLLMFIWAVSAVVGQVGSSQIRRQDYEDNAPPPLYRRSEAPLNVPRRLEAAPGSWGTTTRCRHAPVLVLNLPCLLPESGGSRVGMCIVCREFVGGPAAVAAWIFRSAWLTIRPPK